MNIINILAIEGIDGNATFDLSNGALVALLAIVMVFAILLVIIGITSLVFKLMGLFEMKKELDEAKKVSTNPVVSNKVTRNVDIKDEDMMVAVLIASIDYQNEIKQDVRLVNVREIN